jgi:competence protein ComEA
LDALPGVGPARALAVVRFREANGPFRAVQDLARVPGFGPAALNRLRDRVRVGGR